MSVKRCILRFFAIVLCVLGVQNIASAVTITYNTPSNCYSSYYIDYVTSVNDIGCDGDGPSIRNNIKRAYTCSSCNSGYTKKANSITVATCDTNQACTGGVISATVTDPSFCRTETETIYTCTSSGSGSGGSGGDSGQTSVDLTYECPEGTPQTITCDINAYNWVSGCSEGGWGCADMCQNEEKELVYWKLYDTTYLNTIVRQSENINEYLKNSDGNVFLAPIYKEKIVLDKNGGSGGDDLFYVLNPVGYRDADDNEITSILPPSRSGYIFNGYYAEKTGGLPLIKADGILNTNYSVFLSVSTLYAQWTACSCENGTGATECTATVLNNKCNITWSCNDGYFNSIQSATQSGGYTATCDSCAIVVGSEFTHSDSGRDSGYDCYRSCKPTDVTLSSAVSGKFYYGATAPSQCTATSCQANTYLSSGTCTSCDNAYPYHDADANGATYCYKDCATKTGYTETGRDYNGATDTCEYTPICNKITLDNITNGGTGGTTEVYKKTGLTTYYSDPACTNEITKITLPSKTNAIYAGTTNDCIATNGKLSTSTSCNVSTAETWESQYSCKPGYQYGLNGNYVISGECPVNQIEFVFLDAKDGNILTNVIITKDLTDADANAIIDNYYKRLGYSFNGFYFDCPENYGAFCDGENSDWHLFAELDPYQKYTDISSPFDFNAANFATIVFLYPKYTPNKLTVDYDEDGGSAVSNGSCTYDGNLTLPAAPAKTGYSFAGWKLNDSTVKNAGDSVTCDYTNLGVYSDTSTAVTAQWEECPAGNYCPGDAIEHECPDTHPNSVAGATSQNQCYTSCKVECAEPSTCPVNNASCIYKNDTSTGTEYFNETCNATQQTCVIESFTCNDGYMLVDGECIKVESEFFITTTEDTKTFTFTISAAGNYIIDWGDGNVEQKTKSDVGNTTYSHTYNTAGTYTIGLSGQATEYSTADYTAAISFRDNTNIKSVDGSLGAIFSGSPKWMFYYTFSGCTSLTEIHENLFAGVSGSAEYMFGHTFDNCTSLTEIPENLFAGVTDSASHLFNYTFSNCTSLTEIPENLFASITDSAEGMFAETFRNCTSLASIPENLFASVSGSAGYMFGSTFENCTSLEYIPENLFVGISGSAGGMFSWTFGYCTSLTSIPENLFAGIRGSADWMFYHTFDSCSSLESIPDNLFVGISGSAEGMFDSTFHDCTSLASLPDGLFKNIEGTASYSMFYATFSDCTNLSGYIPANTFEKMVSTYFDSATMSDIFNNTALATTCPDGMYQYITGFESAWSGKVACKPCPESHPYSDAGSISQDQCYKICDDGYGVNGTNDSSAQYDETCEPYYMTIQYACSDCDSGNAPTAPVRCEYGKACKLPENTYEKTDYMFDKWNVACKGCISKQRIVGADGVSSVLMNVGDDIGQFISSTNTGGSFTISPTWNKAIYSVNLVYSSSGGEGDAPTEPTTCTSDAQCILPENTYTKSGYVFNKWQLECDGCGENGTIDVNVGNNISQYITSLNNGKDINISPIWTECAAGSYCPGDNRQYECPNDGQSNAGASSVTECYAIMDCNVGGNGENTCYWNSWNKEYIDNCTTCELKECDEGFELVGTKCKLRDPEFTIETIDMAPGAEFKFEVQMEGTYYVDWGDGSDTEKIEVPHQDCTEKITVSHTYANGGKYTIGMAGQAVSYTLDNTGHSECYNGHECSMPEGRLNFVNNTNIMKLGGKLSDVFGVKGQIFSAAHLFHGCSNLVEIPENLFEGFESVDNFNYAFYGCSSLKEIPDTIFNNVTDEWASFNNTFEGCTSLKMIPENLFITIKKVTYDAFRHTFANCTSLTEIPENLFAPINTEISHGMFDGTFKNCTGLTKLPNGLFKNITGKPIFTDGYWTMCEWYRGSFTNTFDGCINLTGYIPADMFEKLDSAYFDPLSMEDIFNDTALATVCPDGAYQYITGFESAWSGKVACKPCPDGYTSDAGATSENKCYIPCTTQCVQPTCPDNADCSYGNETASSNRYYGTDSCDAAAPTCSMTFTCKAGYTLVDGKCIKFEPEFTITTVEMSAGTTFKFQIGAAGNYIIDWGDGNVEQISKSNVTLATYSHTYNTAGTYTIGLSGQATKYTTNDNNPVISFTNNIYIAELGGSLGDIFNTSTEYMFVNTFAGCTKLTKISGTLFKGLTQPAKGMFSDTFRECYLLEEIPENLFGDISGNAESLFMNTFADCSSLKSIHENLFSNISGSASSMFFTTFYGCTSLENIPENLFSNISGSASSMFASTFYGCTKLKIVPRNLFRGVTGGASSMFLTTFSYCTNLETIYEDLFSGITDGAEYMFYGTFYGCRSLQSVPENLFKNITYASDMTFHGTFTYCTSLISLPDGLFKNINDESGNDSFYGTFYGCTNLTGYVPTDMFQNLVNNGYGQSYATKHPNGGGSMQNIFAGTSLETQCENGMYQYITGFESDWSGKVSCTPCPDTRPDSVAGKNSTINQCFTSCTTQCVQPTCPDNADCSYGNETASGNRYYGTDSCDAAAPTCSITFTCKAGYTLVDGKCIKVDTEFTITTVEMSAGTTFKFQIGAAGNYIIDWGDGNVEQKTKSNVGNTTYSHTYNTAGTYTIGLSGQATQYSTEINTAAIRFSSDTDTSITGNKYIASISGSLGKIFGTLPNGKEEARNPRFRFTFGGCSNLSGTIPAELFDGIEIPDDLEKPLPSRMFHGLFNECKKLSGSIPPKLFANIKGNVTERMFQNAFYYCESLTGSIPENLFAGIKGTPAPYMFMQTFRRCAGLTGPIPNTIFGQISGAPASNMMEKMFMQSPGLTGYVPLKSFEKFNQAGYTTGPMAQMFEGTNLETQCPANEYESDIAFKIDWSDKVACVPCPESHPYSDAGNNSTINQCYTTCTTDCVQPSTCPVNNASCVYKKDTSTGTEYLNGTCNAVQQTCGVESFTCNDGYQKNDADNACVAKTYDIIYKLNDGTNNTTNPDSYTIESETIVLAAPTRDGYTFAGWTENGTPITQIVTGTMGNKTLVAQWNDCGKGYWCANGVKTSCTTYGDEYTTDSVNATKAEDCYKPCEIACTEQTCPDNAKCTHGATSTSGKQYYGGTCSAAASTCLLDFTCNENFEKVDGACKLIPEFTMTTTNIPQGGEFEFWVSAGATLYIDWGDGSAVEKRVTNAGDYQRIAHKYTTAGPRTIHMAGQATAYTTQTTNISITTEIWATTVNKAAITFCINYNKNQCNKYLKTIDGSLGKIFGTLSDGTQPSFEYLFDSIETLEGKIPETLFDGVYGQPIKGMFASTFFRCKNLKGPIPSGLFKDINGTPTDALFLATFDNCENLEGEIHPDLFAGISGEATEALFALTFKNCPKLSGGIPHTLFKNIAGAPQQLMFYGTFVDCSGLSGEIHPDLFAGISGAPAPYMFAFTFQNTSGLTGTLSEKLFENISGAPAPHMFTQIFYGCENLEKIDGALFKNIYGKPAESMYLGTFAYCTNLTGTIPEQLFGNINGAVAKNMYFGVFFGDKNLTGTIPANLFGKLSGKQTYMFGSAFEGCTNLSGFVPPELFAGIDNKNYQSGPMSRIFIDSGIVTQCPENYYQYITGFEVDWDGRVSCTPCPDSHPNSISGKNSTINQCYTTCTTDCVQPDCPENADCSHGNETASGNRYYDTDSCDATAPTCSLDFTCKAGYQKNEASNACEPVQFTATYDCNGGNGNQTVDVTYNTIFTPATDVCARENYTFIGWEMDNTDANSPFTWTYTENKTLVAQWKRNTATCEAGYYLPANAEVCELCLENHYCSGGTFDIRNLRQGIESCPYGLISPAGAISSSDCDAKPKLCAIDFATQAYSYYDHNTQMYGKCEVKECQGGYHIELNACVLNEQPCETTNGTGIKTWNETTKLYDACVPETCNPGYTNNGEQCVPCDNMYDTNGELAVSSYVNECEIAACMYQGEKYILENNECRLICDTQEDDTGRRDWDESSKRCVHKCEPGYITW